MNGLLREISSTHDCDKPISVKESPVSLKHLAELVEMIENGDVSNNVAKEIFLKCFSSGKSPQLLVKEKGLEIKSDLSEIETLCSNAIESGPDAAENFVMERKELLMLLKDLMKATRGQANPKIVDDTLRRLLSE